MRCVFREPSIAIGPGADITAEYQSVSPNVHSGFHSLLPVICERNGGHRDLFITINPLLTQLNVSSANTVSICVSVIIFYFNTMTMKMQSV